MQEHEQKILHFSKKKMKEIKIERESQAEAMEDWLLMTLHPPLVNGCNRIVFFTSNIIVSINN